jgi:hypothetical protein
MRVFRQVQTACSSSQRTFSRLVHETPIFFFIARECFVSQMKSPYHSLTLLTYIFAIISTQGPPGLSTQDSSPPSCVVGFCTSSVFHFQLRCDLPPSVSAIDALIVIITRLFTYIVTAIHSPLTSSRISSPLWLCQHPFHMTPKRFCDSNSRKECLVRCRNHIFKFKSLYILYLTMYTIYAPRPLTFYGQKTRLNRPAWDST